MNPRFRIITSFLIRHPLYSLVFLLLNFSCAAQKQVKPYYEDLSSARPKVQMAEDTARKQPVEVVTVAEEIKPTQNVNAKVDAVLDSIDRFNVTKRFVDGFTIQIYSGQKKEDAMNTKQKIIEETPELIANLQYVQPKFRVTVGHYLTKLDAQKDLLRLKHHFTTAILVPEKIMVR